MPNAKLDSRSQGLPGNHLSIWSDERDIPAFAPLETNIETDVVVVGGGIAGLTASLLLQRAGRRVVLIEARRIGNGETGLTTAHLTELVDARYHDMESKFGRDGARLSADSSRAAAEGSSSTLECSMSSMANPAK
jgi:choline dehydrogenase-like flavoprotein